MWNQIFITGINIHDHMLEEMIRWYYYHANIARQNGTHVRDPHDTRVNIFKRYSEY